MASVLARRAQLDSQIPDWNPGIEEDLDRYLADKHAQSRRLDEENLVLGLGWSPSVCATHELTLPWRNATADRWYRALGGWENEVPGFEGKFTGRYAKQDNPTRTEARQGV